MEYKVLGSDGVTEYTVDTEKVTCNCPHFMYRCTHKPIDSEDRLCKHIAKVFEDHPESVPARLQKEYSQADMSGKDPDGKVRYPRSLFDLYVSTIKSTMSQFDFIGRFEICGSYRRLVDRVSDLDVLVQLIPDYSIEVSESIEDTNKFLKFRKVTGDKVQETIDSLDPDHIAFRPGNIQFDSAVEYIVGLIELVPSWDPFLDYLENVLNYKLITEIGRGSAKAAYMVDGFVHIDFMNITNRSWPYALLHFTGSKSTNIEMRRRANQLGYTLNQYGLTKDDGSVVEGLKTEKDIFEFLKMEYKQPWDR